MDRRPLSDWAALAEIVGTVAVVISLVLVLISIRQNTAELRFQNENRMYDMQNDTLQLEVENEWIPEIFVKLETGEELTAVENRRLNSFLFMTVNRWESAYFWHKQGLMETSSWLEWEQTFTYALRTLLPPDRWALLRPAYAPEFAQYVDAQYVD